jgi:hypothetical protein
MSDVQHNRGTDYLLVQVVFQLLMLDLNLMNCWINLAVEGPFFSIFFSTIVIPGFYVKTEYSSYA